MKSVLKNTIATIVLCLNIGFASAQINYFNYLDYTSEWRVYGISAVAGPWAVQYTKEYITYFIDGDTTINGLTYYKKYYALKDSTAADFAGPYTAVSNYVSHTSPSFIREDASNKFYAYQQWNNTDVPIEDFNLSIGNGFLNDSVCLVYSIDTLYLGSRLLKHYKAQSSSLPVHGVIEGIGTLSINCGMAIEGNRWIVCYKKQNDELNLYNTIPCTSFPIAMRIYSPTSIQTNTYEPQISLLPNPTTGNLALQTNDFDTYNIKIIDCTGKVLYKMKSEANQLNIPIDAFEKGVYFVVISNEKYAITKKIVKI
ncbi:MAG: Secretion system C-terminal sorting domain [Bacteroidota bacterium]|jgi:hypothetical protein